ncbi:unnamed protein product [Cylindrotheca closterium]|uniref:VOC domain-containing protein n=1 Tax=Cylindrotheca closterium TaxID=2856 RepID=A0AAD2FJI5_9STRA|nr:unnamed protein product [Cylindrotheca closterium]
MFRLFTTFAVLSHLVSARSRRFGVSQLVVANRLSTVDPTLIRGGEQEFEIRAQPSRSNMFSTSASAVDPTSIRGGEQEFEIRAQPAPGSPFHYAFPVHNLGLAKHFYGTVMGCEEGRSSEKWQDYSLHGHQIVVHWVGDDYRNIDYFNPVDGDEVPVPHFGIALSVEQFHELAERLKKHGIEFIIAPHLRFVGDAGEQWTMFFKDPSGNNLEFKAMAKPQNLFAKYNVADNSIGAD